MKNRKSKIQFNRISPYLFYLKSIKEGKEAVFIALTYFIFGTFWIFLSDELLYALIKDVAIFKEIQLYKGWFFVFITTLFMFFIIKSVIETKKNNTLYTKKDERIEKDSFLKYLGFSALLSNSNIVSDQLEFAIKNEQFSIHYHPLVDLITGKIIGVEALIRWHHPVRGFISPSEFIPFAEQSGQIYEIERYVVKTALIQKQRWEEECYGDLKISINLSSRTLTSDEDFFRLEALLESFNVDYSNIVFEITETAIITDIGIASKRLERLRKKRISIALDDFGTGYSSLSYLKDVPLNIVKLDRTFINSIKVNSRETFIIKALISLAKDLNYDVIAEGVETCEQLQFLISHNCNVGQGYLFSKPLPIHLINEKIKMGYYDLSNCSKKVTP